MKRTITIRSLLTLMMLGISTWVFSQNVVSGVVKDSESKEPLIGANIVIEGTVKGTTTDVNGYFRLQTSTPLPFKVIVSVIGFENKELDITSSNQEVEIDMQTTAIMGQEIVVSASRVEENILESPVTVEKLDILAIKQAAAPDFYDALSFTKGVNVNRGSLTFTSVNTRGFTTNANTRFVQLIDGMDNSAPLLNFPTGNLVGISELDAESVELVPGAGSALYGPNAFNGILIFNSKSPFDYQGLSVQVKTGVTKSDAGGTHPMNSFSARWAKSFNNKLAFKVNFSILDAEDWVGNDYTTDRFYANQARSNDPGISPDFDGMNLYGDETKITVPVNSALADAIEAGLLASLGIPANPTLAEGFRTLDNPVVTRTGMKEEDLIDDFEARSIKGDAALHYRINDNLEASYSYRYGTGSTIYQGAEKYAIRGFSQQFHKLELKSDHYFVRAYTTLSNAGDSYNMSALGAYVNESFSGSESQWVPTYGVIYGLARLGLLGLANPTVPLGTILSEEDAHRAARATADSGIPYPGTEAYASDPSVFNDMVKDVRENRYFQRNPPGARFIDKSRTYHAEFNYNFVDFEPIDIQVGGNVRRYSLFSDGTIFNEDPEDGTNFERIGINEFGFYTQLSKKVFDEKLKLTGSLRYDKNQNFKGQVTPRLSAVYKVADLHNIRTSFQTGFRNPDTQAQFIYFPSSTGILLGGTQDNAERYGLYHGGAYIFNPITGEQETVDIDYVQPEKLSAFEIGYKGVFDNKVMVDINFYRNWYRDFINQQLFYLKNESTHQGQTLPAGTPFQPYINSNAEVRSLGIGIGVTYNLPKGYVLNGSYNYADFEYDESSEIATFKPGFNTPANRFSMSFSNREIVKNLGFNISYRWQQQYYWYNTWGEANMPSYGLMDAALSYKVKSLKSVIKAGGTNILGDDYRTNIGAPFVGQMYYISITFDQFLN